MRHFFIALAAVLGVFFGTWMVAEATNTFAIQQGGTGTTTAPSSQLLYGSGGVAPTQSYQSVATTSVTCTGSASCTAFTAIGPSPITINVSGASGSGLGTTTPWTRGQVAYVVDNGSVSSVATTTIGVSGPFQLASPGALVGGSNTTLVWTGLATTSQPTAGNLLVSNGAAGVFGIATNTISGSGGVTITAGASVLASGAITVACATCVLSTRQITVAGTAAQITSSAGAQDLSADRTWTLSFPNHIIFPGDFVVGNSTTTNATTTGSTYLTGITASRPLYVDSTGLLTSAGSGVSGNCVKWGANNTLTDQGAVCGSGSGTGIGTISTSTLETAGQIPYWTTTSGYPAKLTSIATTTLTVSGPFISTANVGFLVGGANATFTYTGIATSSNLTAGQLLMSNGGANVSSTATSSFTPSLFPAQVTAGSFGNFVGGTNSTWTWWGLATTSALTAGQLLMSNGAGGVSSIATTTVACSGSVSCTGFTILGSTPITISASGGSTLMATGTPTGAADGNNTVFTTPNSPLLLFVNGVYQTPFTDYNVTGTYTETFTYAPANGAVLTYTYSSLGSGVSLPVSIANGGTGTSTAPTYGKLLVGDSGGNYELMATSSLGISGGSGTPVGTAGQVQYDASGAFGGVSTTTLAFTSFPATVPALGALVGGSNATLTWWGLATSSAIANTEVLFGTSASGVGGNTSFEFNNTINALGIGTSTPWASLTISTSTGPQILLTDTTNASNGWFLRNINGNFYLGTTTGQATSTNSIFSIINGPSGGNATSTFSLTDWVLKQTSQTALLINDAFGTNVIQVNTASTTGNEFEVDATTTGKANFGIDQYGHLMASSTGATPTVSTCGTSPAVTANSTDSVGSVTTGTGSPTACTITFAHAFTNSPVVMIDDASTAVTADISAISTTAFTVSLSAALNSTKIYWIVVQGPGNL